MKFAPFKIFLVSAISGILIFGTTTVATASPAPVNGAGVQQAMTVESYTAFLADKAINDPAAQESLDLFTSCSTEKQSATIDEFNSPTFQQALFGGSSEEKKAQGITETVVANVVPEAEAESLGTVSALANTSRQSSYTKELRSLGVLLFSLRQDFYYQTANGVVQSTQSCNHAASQYYPLGYVTGSTSHFLKGNGQALCRTLWSYELNYGIGHIQGSSYQELHVNGYGGVTQLFYDV